MFLMAVVFLVIGILVHKFKLYFLLAGYNTMTDTQKSNIDAETYGKFFGIHMYVISVIFIFAGFFQTRFPNIEILTLVGLFVVIGNLLYKGSKLDKNESTGESKYSLMILVIPVIILCVIFSFSIKPIDVALEEDFVKINSDIIDFEEIKSVQVLEEAPYMEKVFGSGIGTHNKGTFDVVGYGECIVYTDIKYGDTLILNTDKDTYIINSKTDGLMKEIYSALKNK